MSDVPTGMHRTSHRPLLRRPWKSSDRPLDAIVMPAARPAANLLPAMELAAVLGCRLVVLCSGRTSVAEASGLVDEVPDLSCMLVDLHEGYRNDQLLPFGTGELPEAAAARLGDLSVKAGGASSSSTTTSAISRRRRCGWPRRSSGRAAPPA